MAIRSRIGTMCSQVAEELKGLQEQSTPFSDELALQILATWLWG